MKEWLYPALGTFLCWALWSLIPKFTTRYISPQSAIVYQALAGVLVALGALYVLGFRPETHPTGIALALVTGVLGLLGALSFLYAASRGPIALVVTFTALYPVLTILLAMVIFKEPVTARQGLGILLALGSIVLIAT